MNVFIDRGVSPVSTPDHSVLSRINDLPSDSLGDNIVGNDNVSCRNLLLKVCSTIMLSEDILLSIHTILVMLFLTYIRLLRKEMYSDLNSRIVNLETIVK